MALFPVRCFTCGKVIGHDEERYQEMLTEYSEAREVLDKLGYKRMCCRRMFMSHNFELTNVLSLYKIPNMTSHDETGVLDVDVDKGIEGFNHCHASSSGSPYTHNNPDSISGCNDTATSKISFFQQKPPPVTRIVLSSTK